MYNHLKYEDSAVTCNSCAFCWFCYGLCAVLH